jgi:hypothetical protein
LDGGVTPAFLLDNGPPIVDPVLPSVDPTLSNDSFVDFLNPDSGKTAYVNSWTLSLQRELPRGILVDAAYVGQHGVNLVGGLENINQVSARHLSLGSLLEADITDPAAAAAGILPPYVGFSGSVAQALRPFPQYIAVAQWQEPTAASRYHSFQLKLQKRFSEGSSFLISYAAAKNITNAASSSGFSFDHGRPPDTEKRQLEWAVAEHDIPQYLVASFVYELPFGPGKRFANKAGAAGKVIGGWQIAGIAQYFKGRPIAIAGGQPLLLFGGSNRPNRVPGVDIRTGVSAGSFDPERDLWLNINAFEAGDPFTFGNLGPRLPNTRGFPTFNEDFTIFKFIPFTEHHQLEFRAEFYNVFNRVKFTSIDSDISDPTSFGKVLGTSNPRQIQMMLKYRF